MSFLISNSFNNCFFGCLSFSWSFCSSKSFTSSFFSFLSCGYLFLVVFFLLFSFSVIWKFRKVTMSNSMNSFNLGDFKFSNSRFMSSFMLNFFFVKFNQIFFKLLSLWFVSYQHLSFNVKYFIINCFNIIMSCLCCFFVINNFEMSFNFSLWFTSFFHFFDFSFSKWVNFIGWCWWWIIYLISSIFRGRFCFFNFDNCGFIYINSEFLFWLCFFKFF